MLGLLTCPVFRESLRANTPVTVARTYEQDVRVRVPCVVAESGCTHDLSHLRPGRIMELASTQPFDCMIRYGMTSCGHVVYCAVVKCFVVLFEYSGV